MKKIVLNFWLIAGVYFVISCGTNKSTGNNELLEQQRKDKQQKDFKERIERIVLELPKIYTKNDLKSLNSYDLKEIEDNLTTIKKVHKNNPNLDLKGKPYKILYSKYPEYFNNLNFYVLKNLNQPIPLRYNFKKGNHDSFFFSDFKVRKEFSIFLDKRYETEKLINLPIIIPKTIELFKNKNNKFYLSGIEYNSLGLFNDVISEEKSFLLKSKNSNKKYVITIIDNDDKKWFMHNLHAKYSSFRAWQLINNKSCPRFFMAKIYGVPIFFREYIEGQNKPKTFRKINKELYKQVSSFSEINSDKPLEFNPNLTESRKKELLDYEKNLSYKFEIIYNQYLGKNKFQCKIDTLFNFDFDKDFIWNEKNKKWFYVSPKFPKFKKYQSILFP